MHGSDAPPPRLALNTQNELRSAFRANYPGELLDSNSTPGQRYRALVYHSLKPENRLAWTQWTQIISEKKRMEILEKKGRRPRSSMELFIHMCWEDVPQIDEASLSAGAWRINQILKIRSHAFTLSGRCHLATHKTFDAKLLACYTQQYATDSGLRSPNLTISADRHLMEKSTSSSTRRIGTSTMRCTNTPPFDTTWLRYCNHVQGQALLQHR